MENGIHCCFCHFFYFILLSFFLWISFLFSYHLWIFFLHNSLSTCRWSCDFIWKKYIEKEACVYVRKSLCVEFFIELRQSDFQFVQRVSARCIKCIMYKLGKHFDLELYAYYQCILCCIWSILSHSICYLTFAKLAKNQFIIHGNEYYHFKLYFFFFSAFPEIRNKWSYYFLQQANVFLIWKFCWFSLGTLIKIAHMLIFSDIHV